MVQVNTHLFIDAKKFFRLLHQAADILRRLPSEIVAHIAKLLNWRDVAAILSCCNFDLRKYLTPSDLRSICTTIRNNDLDYNDAFFVGEKNKVLPSLMLDLFDWDLLLNVSSECFLAEYQNLAKIIDWHYEDLNKNLPRGPYMPNYQCIDSVQVNLAEDVLILEQLDDNFSNLSRSMPDQVSFHPSAALVAITTVHQSVKANQNMLTLCCLQVRTLGSSGPGCPNGHILFSSHKFPSGRRSNFELMDSRFYPEWSPCGRYLSVVERSTSYTGLHSLARVHVLFYDSTKTSIGILSNLDITCRSHSISNNLWIGPGRMLLPDPLNQGGEPCILDLDSNASSATLLKPTEVFSETAYLQHPCGLLTGLTNGCSAFVRFCDSEDVCLPEKERSHQHLGGHEHHVIVVLDNQQKRSFEISVPGLVVEISSVQDHLCLLYRPHAAVKFDSTEPVVVEKSNPSEIKYRPHAFAPYSHLTAEEGPSALTYHPYPLLDQPWIRKHRTESSYHRRHHNDPDCPHKISSIKDRNDLPLTREFLNSCRQIWRSAETLHAYDSVVYSSDEYDDDDDDADDAREDDDTRNMEVEQRKLVSAMTETSPFSHSRTDSCEGYIDVPCVDDDAQMLYAEFSLETKKIVSIKNLQPPSSAYFKRETAFECHSPGDQNGRELNKILTLGRPALEKFLTVTENFVHFRRCLWKGFFEKSRLLSRLHRRMPLIRDVSGRAYVISPNAVYSASWDWCKLGYTGLLISSRNAGEDVKHVSSTVSEKTHTSPITYQIRTKKK